MSEHHWDCIKRRYPLTECNCAELYAADKEAELDADDRAIANRHDDLDWWRTQGNPDWVDERNR